MKKIEAVIRSGKLEEVLDQLKRHQIYGVTVTQAMGCGRQEGKTKYYRGTKISLGLFQRVKLELVVKDSWVDEVITVISETAHTGEIGDGKIFVYNVEQAYRIRNGDMGEDAIT